MKNKIVTILVITTAVALGLLLMVNHSGTTISETDRPTDLAPTPPHPTTSPTTTAPSTAPPSTAPPSTTAPTDADAGNSQTPATIIPGPTPAAVEPNATSDSSTPTPTSTSTSTSTTVPVSATPPVAIDGLHVSPATRPHNTHIGDDAADGVFKLRAETTTWGAGIWRISLADYRQAVSGEGAEKPYVVAQTVSAGGYELYPYAARHITINGQLITLDNVQWNLIESDTSNNKKPNESNDGSTTEQFSDVTYRVTIADGSDSPVLTIDRRYHLAPGDYHVHVEQRLTNHTANPLEIIWKQNGQGDPVNDDAAYLGDRRMFVAGYFDINPKYERDYSRSYIYTKNAFISRTELISPETQSELAIKYGGTFIDFRLQRDAQGNALRDSRGKPILINPDRGFAADLRPLWPNPELGQKQTELAWIASENRYFVVATLPNVPDDVATAHIPSLDTQFPKLGVRVIGQKGPKRQFDEHGLILTLETQPTTVGAGETADIDFAIYAGPRQKDVFKTSPYKQLFFIEMIRYELGCALCTFQWLARSLLWFLEFIHGIVFDWGVAIIILVIVVRGLLHPITKRSQINMMRMSKQMASIQPEIEKLKKKYGDDKQKIQQEQMGLFREKGINPMNMLGCAPMFLQMPIWVALYAMLYYAIELRHVSAFYGVFQWLSNGQWAFLADLSQPDRFIQFAGEGYTLTWLPFVNPHFAGINIIPILMAVVFFVQQKLMTPPAQNEQQAQQQKMMRFMTLLFPVFLYSAPSGLTLYMVASTAAGIIDSTIVRRHIKREEEAGTLLQPKQKKEPGRFGKWAARVQADVLARQQEAQQAQKHGKSNHKQRKPKR